MANQKGLFITLEGIDGSGKSLLARNLTEQLQQEGIKTLLTKEPGGSVLGKTIRSLLQDRPISITDKAEYLLFAADRAQHMQEVILPHLEKNYWVLSDRCADSSIVYQGYGRGLSIDMIKTINAWAMNTIQPDSVLYVDIDIDTAFERITKRNEQLTAFEQEKKDFFTRVQQGYEALYANKKNVIRLDGTLSPEDLTQEAYSALQTTLKRA